MSVLKQAAILMFIFSYSAVSSAAVQAVDIGSCSVFSESEKSDGEKKGDDGNSGDEEEPDCE